MNALPEGTPCPYCGQKWKALFLSTYCPTGCDKDGGEAARVMAKSKYDAMIKQFQAQAVPVAQPQPTAQNGGRIVWYNLAPAAVPTPTVPTPATPPTTVYSLSAWQPPAIGNNLSILKNGVQVKYNWEDYNTVLGLHRNHTWAKVVWFAPFSGEECSKCKAQYALNNATGQDWYAGEIICPVP